MKECYDLVSLGTTAEGIWRILTPEQKQKVKYSKKLREYRLNDILHIYNKSTKDRQIYILFNALESLTKDYREQIALSMGFERRNYLEEKQTIWVKRVIK